MYVNELRDLVQLYKKHLIGLNVKARELTETQHGISTTGQPLLQHCLYMLLQMEKFLHEDEVTNHLMSKVLQSIGFIQGCLQAEGIFTMNQLQEHYREEDEDEL